MKLPDPTEAAGGKELMCCALPAHREILEILGSELYDGTNKV